MLWLVLAFFALLIGFGRVKGFNTVLSLVLTCAAVFFIMIPAIIKGYNIYLVTFITTVYTIVMTLCIVIGVHPKSIAAAVGCTCGVGFAGLLTVAMQDVMYITGLIDEDSSFVMYINGDTVINLRGVIFAAIVIGALGATMDVAMSIASSLDEILFHKPDISDLDLMRSGLNIGRDIMGTMANTLVLAYVGSSLHLILLLMAYNNDIGAIVNRESIAVELLQSVAGSIGILFTVPATAAVTVAARRWFIAHARQEQAAQAAVLAGEEVSAEVPVQPEPQEPERPAVEHAEPTPPEPPEEETPKTVEQLWREYGQK